MISSLSASIQRTQDIADAVSKIKQSSIDAAARRKEFASAKLQELRERLRMMLMFSNVGSKGNATAAAQLAKELAAAVKEYASASGAIQEAGGNADASASAVSANVKADNEFITGAKQLASQIKAFIAAEVQKAKRQHKHEDGHEKTINELNGALDDASKSLGIGTISPAYTVDISVASISLPT